MTLDDIKRKVANGFLTLSKDELQVVFTELEKAQAVVERVKELTDYDFGEANWYVQDKIYWCLEPLEEESDDNG